MSICRAGQARPSSDHPRQQRPEGGQARRRTRGIKRRGTPARQVRHERRPPASTGACASVARARLRSDRGRVAGPAQGRLERRVQDQDDPAGQVEAPARPHQGDRVESRGAVAVGDAARGSARGRGSAPRRRRPCWPGSAGRRASAGQTAGASQAQRNRSGCRAWGYGDLDRPGSAPDGAEQAPEPRQPEPRITATAEASDSTTSSSAVSANSPCARRMATRKLSYRLISASPATATRPQVHSAAERVDRHDRRPEPGPEPARASGVERGRSACWSCRPRRRRAGPRPRGPRRGGRGSAGPPPGRPPGSTGSCCRGRAAGPCRRRAGPGSSPHRRPRAVSVPRARSTWPPSVTARLSRTTLRPRPSRPGGVAAAAAVSTGGSARPRR